jgi:hypothetical protein
VWEANVPQVFCVHVCMRDFFFFVYNCSLLFFLYTRQVKSALAEISEALPKWQNLNEQVLALRLNNYDVEAAIAWKLSEVQHGGAYEPLTLRDAVLIKSLEDGLRKKGEQVPCRIVYTSRTT